MSSIALKEKQFMLGEDWVEVQDGLRASPQIREIYPSDCGFRFRAFQVSDRRVVYEPLKDSSPAHRYSCPVCARGAANRLAVKAYHRLFAYDWDHVWCITLTTPVEFIDRDRIDDGGYVLQRMRDLLDLAKKYMKKVHSNVPYMMTFHHWASSKPLDGVHYHVHITAPCIRLFRPEFDSVFYLRKLEPKLSKYRLDEVKRIWANIVDFGYDRLDLNYEFYSRKTRYWKGSNDELETSGGSGRIMHWLKYIYRYYIQDVDKWFVKNEFVNWDRERLYWLKFHLFEVKVMKQRKLVEDGVVSIQDYESVKSGWGERTRNYGAFSRYTRGSFVDMDVVKKRIEKHFNYSKIAYDPVTKLIVDKDITPHFECRVDGVLYDKDLVVRTRVVYIDVPLKLEDFVVFLQSPVCCMRWSYRPKKRLRKRDS